MYQINTLFPLFSSIVEEHQKYIEQLQQTLFEKDNEKNSLNQRLNELELELQKTIDAHTSKLQSVVEERDALVEQLTKENNQMREELSELKLSADLQQSEILTNKR